MRISFLLLFFLTIGFFVNTQLAHGNTRFDCGANGHFSECWSSGGEVHSIGFFEPISNIFVTGIKYLLYGLFMAIGWLASVAIIIFEWAINPQFVSGPAPLGFFNDAGVYAMWKFVRDFFNLFFILTLLYIAFTIIFQIASDYKKTLLSILLAALFVNFSFPVTRLMIDAANVPMYFFVNQMGGNSAKGGILGNMMSATDIQDILIPGYAKPGVNVDVLSIPQLLMAIVFLFIFSISLVVLAVLFVIRFAALLILLIFSSVGFAGSVVPGISKYSKMWWEKFTEYAIFGPVAMLMLFVATRLFSIISSSQMKQQLSAVAQRNSVGELSSLMAAMAMFSVPMVILWMAMTVANTLSIAGAGGVVGMGEKFAKWSGKQPFRGAWAGAKFGGRKYEKWVAGKGNAGKYFSPTALAGAWKSWREESAHDDKAPIERASASIQDRLNKVFGEHTDHAFEVARKQSSEKEKHITSTSNDEDYISHEVLNAVHNKQAETVAGGLNALAKGNGLNTFLVQAAHQERYKNMKDEDGNDLLTKDANGEAEVSSTNMRKLLRQILIDSGEKNEEMLVKQMMAISETATGSGNFAFGGMAVYDGKGGFRMAKAYKEGDTNEDTGVVYDHDGDEQADWAAGKVKNLESQERQRKIHPDSLFKRTASGGFGDLNDEVAEEIIKTFTYADVSQADRSRDDLKEAIHKAYTNFDKNPRFKELYEKNKIFKQYVQTVVKMKRGRKKDDNNAEWDAANGPGTKYEPNTTADSGSGDAVKREKNAKEVAAKRKKRR